MKNNEKQLEEPIVHAMHRVHEYEEALLKTKERGFKCLFSEFRYQAKSLFVARVIGTVETERFRILVTWDDYGRAFVQGSRAEEFDLILIN